MKQTTKKVSTRESINARSQNSGNEQKAKSFAVYTFRRQSGGRWRLHKENTFQDALDRAQSLYKTGQYRRVEVKKILHDASHSNKQVKTLKVLRPRSRIVLKYGFYALICAGLFFFLMSLV